MLWKCGQLVDGGQEFCDACWECSSRCRACADWLNKEHVGPAGLCADCEQERMHPAACFECNHKWKVYGFPIRCPQCESFNIMAGNLEDLFYQDIVEKKQLEYIKQLQSKPLQAMEMMGEMEKASGGSGKLQLAVKKVMDTT